MPAVRKGESEKEYVSRATKPIHDEGKGITATDPQMRYKQAAAIAHSMYQKKKKKKGKKNKKNESLLIPKFSDYLKESK